MKLNKMLFGLLIAGMFSHPATSLAQGEPEDVAAVSDAFQDSFYESLKQKGIENYDKAIEALEKCNQISPDRPEVYNELGKNYLFSKDYKKSYDSFEKAFKLDPKNKWYLAGMYDVCYETQDYNQAIVIVKQLVPFDASYKEDLTSLYMKTAQFDKALDLINDLNATAGHSEKRDLYKADILRDPKMQNSEMSTLLEGIKTNPKDESNYTALITLYLNSGQEDKANQITKQLEAALPNSEWAQISLFKTYLDKNDGTNAAAAMTKVLKSEKIDVKIKHRVVNEFLIFAKNNPQFDPDLQKAIGYFNDDKEVKTAKEIGKFYQNKKDWDKAIEYYELDGKSNPNDLETTLLLLQAYVETQQFDKAAQRADAMTELFPLQPELYYYSGLAYNQLKNFKKAKQALETGIDYVVDNRALEINFNIQLGEAWSGLGDVKKKEAFFAKADQLLKQKK